MLTTLSEQAAYRGQIAHREWLHPQSARYGSLEPPPPARLREALAELGITRLYSHQAQAFEAARRGEHVGVLTATASGKTLCYQLPLLEAALADPRARGLLLFPTKALAQDQLRKLEALLRAAPLLRAGIYDGDTPQAERAGLRASANLLLSNPDMLHVGVLPNHQRWARFFANLRYVVIDEAHVYRGVFGSNVALLLRRLRRLCDEYGSRPQFICCSATIANPQEHLQTLIGAPVTLVDDDGAPRGSREFVFWNPPPIHRQAAAGEQQQVPQAGEKHKSDGATRRSTNAETTALFSTLVRAGIKTLTFTRARKIAELMLRYVQDALAKEAPELVGRVASYRAGYLPAQRRKIEQALADDELLGVISTNALELGVDIGGLDAVLLNGYPGTVASTWQQVGRAGRSGGHSLAVLVALEDPIDQFYMRHPEQFFGRSHEHARVNLENPYILADHLRCAAYEKPLSRDDERYFGAELAVLVNELSAEGLLRLRQGRAYAPIASYPAEEVNIRSSSSQQFELIDVSQGGKLIERVDAARALYELHPGAVYLHQGEEYLVTDLDLAQQRASARPASVSYYTQPRDVTDIQVLERLRERPLGPTSICFANVDVTRTIVGYRRKAHYSEIMLGAYELDLPPQSFATQAVFLTLPRPICQRVLTACGDLPGALHALEHAMIGMLPIFALCDRWDIGGVSTALHPDTGQATIFIYDGIPGGVGITELGYEQLEAWLGSTLHLLAECPCESGCPSCVHSPKCGNGNQPLDKGGAQLLAELILGNQAT